MFGVRFLFSKHRHISQDLLASSGDKLKKITFPRDQADELEHTGNERSE